MRVLIAGSPFAASEQEKSWGERGRWPCQWIGCAEAVEPPFVTAYRCVFTQEAAATVRVHVTADERYDLFLDGERIGRGSERGDADNWFFETYDLALTPGEHLLAARVWSLGPMAPFAQRTVHPGFLLAPQERAYDTALGTGTAAWEAKVLPGYTFLDPITAWGTGANLSLDGKQFAWNFERGEGALWQPAVTLKSGADALWQNEVENEHLLRPAVLPPMKETPYRAGRVRHIEAVPSRQTHDIVFQSANHLPEEMEAWTRLLAGQASLTIPAHTRRRVLLDLENYLCAYPVVVVSGGAGGLVRVHWQESLYTDPRRSVKGNRDEIEGKRFVAVWHVKDGIGDTFLPDGGEHRLFETLWWQCGRYVEILVETQETPLTLEEFRLNETGYPLEMQSAFAASDSRLAELIPLTYRTLQMCAHETYMDCPYFEQLMYIGDTRLQALVTYVTTTDDRLPRKAVEMLGASRIGNGLTQSRYPSRVRQIIPPFSLWWIGMVYDYALWRGDRAFVRTLLPTMRGVIDHFLRLYNVDGLIEGAKGWNSQDWVPEWKDGTPPEGYDGVNGLINWQMAYALERAAEVETWLEEPEQAVRCRRLSRELAARLKAVFWDQKRGLFSEDPAHRHFSEHTQCIALLSGLLTGEVRASTLNGLLNAPDLARTTIYFSHYLFETLTQAGRTDVLLAKLSLWHDLTANGLKTTVESPEPTRSDCHAWGAHPLYHFFASLLGIRPAEMGFASVRIAPRLGSLQSARGSLAHPKGIIEVDLQREERRLKARVTLPADLTGIIEVGETRIPLQPGLQEFEIAETA